MIRHAAPSAGWGWRGVSCRSKTHPHRPRCARPLPPLKRGKDSFRHVMKCHDSSGFAPQPPHCPLPSFRPERPQGRAAEESRRRPPALFLAIPAEIPPLAALGRDDDGEGTACVMIVFAILRHAESSFRPERRSRAAEKSGWRRAPATRAALRHRRSAVQISPLRRPSGGSGRNDGLGLGGFWGLPRRHEMS